MPLDSPSKIIVAPDSFKECLGAGAVCEVLSRALGERWPGADIVRMPLADGGEGTAEILGRALGADRVCLRVTGPVGEPVEAAYWRTADTAVLEVASACGLPLVPPALRDPFRTTTTGVGELLKAAFQSGVKRLFVGLGGSGTCDGGAGMLGVPGLREAARGVDIRVLYDVDCPLLGPRGTARVYGPQKGARDLDALEERLRDQVRRIFEETGLWVDDLPGAGAAGGLGGAMAACLGARLVPGIDTVLDLSGFDAALPGTDLILTGEGCSDRQTLSGKVPYGVLRRAAGVPVVLLSGRIREREALLRAGFAACVQVTPEAVPIQEALRPEVAERCLREAALRGL